MKTLTSIAIAASLFSLQARAADLSSAEASRGEQLQRAQHAPTSAATLAAPQPAAANDFLQEAERGEYLRSATVQQRSGPARAVDARSPAEAARGTR